MKFSRSVLILAATTFMFAAKPAAAQSFLGVTPVQFTYTCPSATGTLPTCTTSFTLPWNRILVIEYVSGSALPLNPNANNAFPNGQASLTIQTQIGGSTNSNIIGPNYALANSLVWFFTNPVKFYSDDVPVVANNGGPVILQGYTAFK